MQRPRSGDASLGAGVTDADILNDAKTPGDVVSYFMGRPHQHRFGSLDKTNTKNVQKLVPAWMFSFGGENSAGSRRSRWWRSTRTPARSSGGRPAATTRRA